MITPRFSAERHHVRRRHQELWFTFHPEQSGKPRANVFEPLIALNEGLIPPGGSVRSFPLPDAEVITYVLEGALASEGLPREVAFLQAGEFQRRESCPGIHHRETNRSQSAWARVFQIALRSSPGGPHAGREMRRFSSAQRRGGLCLVASQDEQGGALRIHSRARVYSALLDSGRHLAHELVPLSCAWLHVVAGGVQVGELVLASGDGAGVAGEHALSLIAREASEILLVELASPQQMSSGPGLNP